MQHRAACPHHKLHKYTAPYPPRHGAVLQVSTVRETIWDEHAAIARAPAASDENLAETLIRARTVKTRARTFQLCWHFYQPKHFLKLHGRHH